LSYLEKKYRKILKSWTQNPHLGKIKWRQFG